ncbi:MAG: relaxase/mobilization nuclease domain-containing protein [Beduini sp.]|uniref:relaxase/mobilization nuclease domain-containing protein n=1 Tax=Beduini sp. TaxID=1922300 RepID=UPI0039A02F5B
MATTGMWAVKSRLDHLVGYVSDPLKTVIQYTTDSGKTLDREYVSCLNCSQIDPKSSMENTKKLFNDESKILVFHGFQSFEEDEIDADLAHQIGVEFAEKMWGERFEIIVTTHLNTDNIHNHFLLNSTSFVDGKRYCNTYKDLYRMRNISDELCREHGLSVIEQRKNVSKSRRSYFKTKTIRELVKEDVDEALNICFTKSQFLNELELLGYKVEIKGNNISVLHPLAQKHVRLKSLGSNYTNEKIIERMLDTEPKRYSAFPMYDQLGFDIRPYYEKYKQRKLTGLQRLFLHYQYVLKIIPKDHSTRPNQKYSKEYIEAIKEIDSFSRQTIIICKNNIETLDDLYQFVDKTKDELSQLEKLRQKYRNKIRYTTDENEVKELKEKAKSLSPEIAKLRKQLVDCETIEERSTHISKFIDEKENRRTRDYERN